MFKQNVPGIPKKERIKTLVAVIGEVRLSLQYEN
jgi:hypothetical protein